MKRVINTSEVLGTIQTSDGICEVCASADAAFDESAGRLVVNLETFLRPAALVGRERHWRAEWMPKNETVSERASLDECHEMARDLFRRWVRKVRDATPQLHPA